MNQASEIIQNIPTNKYVVIPNQQVRGLRLSPLPMQYLGSKSRIANWIGDEIFDHFPKTNHVLDLFAGSGVVSLESISRGASVTSNDIQPYSFCVLKALLTSNRKKLAELIEILESLDIERELLKSGRNEMNQLLSMEDIYFKMSPRDFDWKKYAKFCDSTVLVHDNSDVAKLKSLNQWNLISKYYSNTYFGVRQCLEIDMLRELAEGLDENLKTQLMAAVISVMTYLVSSTTHLAQYLKISSQSTADNITKKRKGSIIQSVITRLCALSEFTITKSNQALNMDYLSAIYHLPYSDTTVIYADPPYFKEHYSRYYHLLDTFYLYDFPKLTYNSRINGVTKGRYRIDRVVSDFGLKTKVGSAFQKMFEAGADLGLPIVLSYANTSLVGKEELITIAENEGYDVNIRTIKLMHSGQGQKRNKIVKEYLFLCSI